MFPRPTLCLYFMVKIFYLISIIPNLKRKKSWSDRSWLCVEIWNAEEYARTFLNILFQDIK